MNPLFINNFLSKIRPRLRAIAYQTKGEACVGDLENEAYLLLLEFIDENQREPTLEDQG